MTQKRNRCWLEVSVLDLPCRVEVDANAISGEPEESCARHTPPGDRSGELWLPGWPKRAI